MISSLPPRDENTSGAVEVRIADELVRRLRGRASAMTADPTVTTQLRAQVHVIVRRTFERLDATHHTTPPAGSTVGTTRARQNIHPSDSLTAATLLFDIALAEMSSVDHHPSDVARALNRSIMEQVVPASLAYVDVLLERLAVAHTEERLGISRELHDRVAHSIAAGIQRIHLSRQPSDSAAERIAEALRLLESALDETRSIAVDLRHSVGDKRLDEAISDYVADLSAEPPPVGTHSEGIARVLAAGVQEEAFIIIREAIHNARRHSRAHHIQVTSTWLAERLTIRVADDGVGFDRDAIRPVALGLIAAQERAELIGADLAIDTRLGAGTTVTLTIAEPAGRI